MKKRTNSCDIAMSHSKHYFSLQYCTIKPIDELIRAANKIIDSIQMKREKLMTAVSTLFNTTEVWRVPNATSKVALLSILYSICCSLNGREIDRFAKIDEKFPYFSSFKVPKRMNMAASLFSDYIKVVDEVSRSLVDLHDQFLQLCIQISQSVTEINESIKVSISSFDVSPNLICGLKAHTFGFDVDSASAAYKLQHYN